MKRIINIVTQMEAGGAQGAAIRMTKEMRSKGYDAETWFLYKKTDAYSNEKNVLIIYNSANLNLLAGLKIFIRLIKLLKKSKPDGIITYTHYANIFGAVTAFFTGIKNRVATIRNPVWRYPATAKLVDKIIGAIGFYTTIITVSSSVKDSCRHYPRGYKKRIKTVYNGVPPRKSSLTKKEARLKFNLPFEDNLLVNVGRLHPQKNQQLLINLMSHLPGYNLAIAGDGELKDTLTNLALELNVLNRIFFIGEINPDDIPDFLKAGDAFLFPSLYEGFGFALFEAAYNDLPVIASNIPSNVEVLTFENNEKAGIIVEDMNEESWIKSIKQLGQHDVKTTIINNMKKRLPQFDFNTMVEAYIHYATKD